MHHDEAVKVIAYRIWEEEGRPEGRALDHWRRQEGNHDAQPGMAADHVLQQHSVLRRLPWHGGPTTAQL
jgi:hypothetical protein